tara:strand:- start:14 stop:217 length:204 start_codon:yes stop_codon:yes gene_type:complete
MTDMDKLMLFIAKLQKEKTHELIEAKEEFGEPTDDDYLVASIYSYIEGQQSVLCEVMKFINKGETNR